MFNKVGSLRKSNLDTKDFLSSSECKDNALKLV